MEVKMYVYKSPYPSPIQIGREDTTQKQAKDTSKEIVDATKGMQTTKEIENIAQNKNVSANILDVYA